MRKWMMLVAFCSSMLSGCTTNVKEYVIKGSVAWGNPDVYLTVINENGKLDTIQHVVPVNGKFEMKGNLSEPKISFLVVKDGKGRIPLLLQDTILRVDIKANDLSNVRNFVARGSALQDRKSLLDQKEIEIYQDLDSVLARYYRAESEHNIMEKMHEMAALQVMSELYDQEENRFIQENRDNILGLSLVFYRYQHLNYEQLKPKFDMLSETMKKTPEGLLIAARYDKLGEVKVGATAHDFKIRTMQGDTLRLYGTRGSVKILDFWASWCGPCRKENPHLVEIYKKYKDKNLLMIGISMDTNEKAWKEAVEADGLEWIQACDFNGSSGPVAKDYRISGIPHIFVLDGNNKIIGEGLRGKEVDELLAKYL